MFRPGQPVEFRSGDRGGCWKSGVVAEVFGPFAAFGVTGRNVRIKVGEGVYVVRPVKNCRAIGELCEGEMDGTERPLVLYHAQCADGFCAAWVAHRIMPDAEFVAVQYGQDPPDVTGREVFVLDFSYKRAVTIEMTQKAKKFVCLDHHKTACDELVHLSAGSDEGLIRFDMDKSGGRLAWEYFFRGKPSPWLVDYTEDRDLWRWRLPDSKAISAWIAASTWSFEAWDLFDNPGRKELECRVEQGEAILRYQARQIESQAANASEIDLDGHKVLAVNATMLISEIAGKLAEGRPFGASFFTRADGKQVWSLRSRDGAIDVSEIARKRGGGGHRNAAGFVADCLKLAALAGLLYAALAATGV